MTDYSTDDADSSIIYVVKDIYMYAYDREGNLKAKSRFEVKYGVCDYHNGKEGKKDFYVLAKSIDIDTDVEGSFGICIDIILGESEMAIPNGVGRFTYYRRIE